MVAARPAVRGGAQTSASPGPVGGETCGMQRVAARSVLAITPGVRLGCDATWAGAGRGREAGCGAPADPVGRRARERLQLRPPAQQLPLCQLQREAEAAPRIAAS